MSSEELKEKVKEMKLVGTRAALVGKLIVEGMFDAPVTSNQLVHRLSERFGKKISTAHIQTIMKIFMSSDIVHAVRLATKGKKINYWVLTSVSRDAALGLIGKDGKTLTAEKALFSETLTTKMEKDFCSEMRELHYNFGKNGNCTAFMLRKILEKLIILAFSKHGKGKLIEDAVRPGGYLGLAALISKARIEKVGGLPFLTNKTAREIAGIKFLGDTAAHNPLVNVDMTTILPQMPFIITAFEELSSRL